jgi:type II secretory pathway pseudopilin PulG
MKKLNGLSIIEVLVIIAMISALLVVAAPSFYSIFKQQFLIYNAQHFIQDVKKAQSDAFIENQYYKVGLNELDNKFTIWKYHGTEWINYVSRPFKETTSIIYENNLSDNVHIMYGPNGNAYRCSVLETPTQCVSNPLNNTARFLLKNDKKEVSIEFLENNGYVSSNISVK